MGDLTRRPPRKPLSQKDIKKIHALGLHKKEVPVYNTDITKDEELNEIRKVAHRLGPNEKGLLIARQSWVRTGGSKMWGLCPRKLHELRNKLNVCMNNVRRKPDIVCSYFTASNIPVGTGAEEKLLSAASLTRSRNYEFIIELLMLQRAEFPILK